MQEEVYLLVGLGNPGEAYVNTRHNLGFRVIECLANKHGCDFRRAKSLYSLVAQGRVLGKKVLFLKPETYMNSSGEAVRACMSYYGVSIAQICVICDDVYLPLGKMRMRTAGGDGGHNGLKSVSTHLGTQEYSRLRAGVGGPEERLLADYVLAPFREEEKQEILSLLQRACDALECWIGEGILAAMQKANASPEKLEGEQKDGK